MNKYILSDDYGDLFILSFLPKKKNKDIFDEEDIDVHNNMEKKNDKYEDDHMKDIQDKHDIEKKK